MHVSLCFLYIVYTIGQGSSIIFCVWICFYSTTSLWIENQDCHILQMKIHDTESLSNMSKVNSQFVNQATGIAFQAV